MPLWIMRAGRIRRIHTLNSAAPGVLDPFSFGLDLSEKRTMATPVPDRSLWPSSTWKLIWSRKGHVMYAHLTAAMAPVALSTHGLVTYLQGLFGPLFLGIVGIVAIFFLFTREINRFVQFIVLAVAIAVIFYTPGIVHTLATGIANALGVH